MYASHTLSAQDALKAQSLRRMRFIATGLLVLMAVVFVLASLGAKTWPWLGAVRAFAEAGMVGACADWFAVTALFRHPLGLKIPHTGIIPRNKERIGEALGSFIAENFLTREVLDGKLRQLELARWGGEWLSQPGQARKTARQITAALPEIVRLLPENAARDGIGSLLLTAAKSVPAAALASKSLAVIWNETRSQAVLDWGIAQLSEHLGQHKATIHERVEAQSGRWTPKFVDRLIAGKITAGVYDLLREMREPSHPWRQEIRNAVQSFIEKLAHDPELGATADAFKAMILEDPRLHQQARQAWETIEAGLVADDSAALTDKVEHILLAVVDLLKTNETARATINTWAQAIAGRLIAPRRHEIGRFVAQVVATWDSKIIVDKLELQVGPDLQYIRINGTLIGGLVGLTIYGVSHFTGL